MSTLNATNIKNATSASTNIVLDGSGNANLAANLNVAGNISVVGSTSIGGTLAMASSFFMRNKIINGDMRIDQRNSGATVTVTSAANAYGVDRWYGQNGTAQSFTMTQSTDTPNGNYPFSLKISNTTGVAATGAQQRLVGQTIEGYNVADVGLGTAACQTLVLTFWVKSSTTGTYGVAVENPTGANSYIGQYVVNAANTWEFKTINVSAITSGTFATTTSGGLGVYFDLGCSSSFEGTASTWNSADRKRVAGNVSLFANNNQNIYITGVQLEVGSVATPFERRPYGLELMLCQRYFQFYTVNGTIPVSAGTGLCTSGSSGFVQLPYIVPVRAVPTSTTVNNGTYFSVSAAAGALITCTALTSANQSLYCSTLQFTVASGVTAGNATYLYGVAGQTGTISINAEL